MRRRIESANAAATEPMKLCNRTRSALDFLLKCKNISRIVGALTNLGKFDVEIPLQHISLRSPILRASELVIGGLLFWLLLGTLRYFSEFL